ncbi:MAG: penicillin-binding protein 1A [Woeseiaceae bacterium]
MQHKKSGRSRKRLYFRLLLLLSGLGLSAAMAATAAVIGAYYYVAPSLPPAETIREIPLQIPLRIFSRDGRLIGEVGERRRIIVTFEELPRHVVDAFVAAEDRRFFQHPGIDYQGILRAGIRMIGTGEISGGGSTLTQQLARDYFLTREQLFTRKLREAFLAYKIEQEFSKPEILALFLNKMFFGQRAYGVAAAAQVYFGKALEDVDVAEAATLAGVLPAPSQYNPVRSPTNATVRRSYVLERMLDLDYIDKPTYQRAMAYPMESKLYGTANELSAPYVAEMVRREMLSRYGEETYRAGFEVVTTLDSRLQSAAAYSLRNGLLEFTRRRGYKGPIAEPGVDPEILKAPYEDWPEEIRLALADQPNPGELDVAIVTALHDDNSAEIVLQNGSRSTIPWHGISWAKPFIDRETTGPAPETVADVLAPGEIIHVMPTTLGSWALAQVPEAQAAVVSVDPLDGAITSLSGGFDFTISKFNRAVQAYRQPGSSFKPFIYSAALEHGNTLATIVDDSPVVIVSSELEDVWRPINYTGRFYGPTRVRDALVRSMNLASVRLLLYNTGVMNAVRHLEPFGLRDAALPRNGSLALGGGNAAPLDMAQAYATFANGGYAVKPYVIDSISGPDGEILYRAEPLVVCRECEDLADDTAPLGLPALEDTMSLEQMADFGEDYRPDASIAPDLFADIKAAPRVISEQNAYLIQDTMRDVIVRGTGRRARVLERSDLSGKTGTSNDRRDAWFGGFNGDLVSVVWVGYDDDLPLGPGEEGSRTALPIWIEFMRIVLKGVPLHQLPMPEGVINVLISKRTGCPASAVDPSYDVMFEIFREGHVPVCEVADAVPDPFNEPGALEDDEAEPEELF